MDDRFAFGELMLNHAVYCGERLLSRPTIALMTTDQITPAQKGISRFFLGFWDSRGWGLDLAIVIHHDELTSSPGRFGWDGGYGTLL